MLNKRDYLIENYINIKQFQKRIENIENLDRINAVPPFNLYFDDYETNNNLGGYAMIHTLCEAYYNFPTIPQYMQSQLQYVFVAAVFKSKDHKNFGNDAVLHRLIDEIKFSH